VVTIDEGAEFFRELQDRITRGLEALDGSAKFREDLWTREGGGGGRTRILEEGAVFEKAGVNWSDVHGELAEDFAKQLPGDGRAFRASGVSLVLHPRSPMIPTVHANFRMIERGQHGAKQWFGGGADLTPYYPYRDDVVHFHRTWKTVCDAHDPRHYPTYKKHCDEYFFLKHRGETRGVGGIFFDNLDATDATFAFVRDAGDAFLGAYVPIVERRRAELHGERERAWQLYRRGRYVEFNLLYDRGTTFGLRTNGRVESILMSLPPLAAWRYDHRPEPGSREAELAAFLKPIDWLGESTGSG
jgi:coproporphyrinogen III oxidase